MGAMFWVRSSPSPASNLQSSPPLRAACTAVARRLRLTGLHLTPRRMPSAEHTLLVQRQQAAHPLRVGGHFGLRLRWLWPKLGSGKLPYSHLQIHRRQPIGPGRDRRCGSNEQRGWRSSSLGGPQNNHLRVQRRQAARVRLRPVHSPDRLHRGCRLPHGLRRRWRWHDLGGHRVRHVVGLVCGGVQRRQFRDGHVVPRYSGQKLVSLQVFGMRPEFHLAHAREDLAGQH
eukprot:scaffold11859_cov62-Phaeocystis_antarctica.AAC.1